MLVIVRVSHLRRGQCWHGNKLMLGVGYTNNIASEYTPFHIYPSPQTIDTFILTLGAVMSGIDGSNRVTNSTESNKLGLAAITMESDYSNGVGGWWSFLCIPRGRESACSVSSLTSQQRSDSGRYTDSGGSKVGGGSQKLTSSTGHDGWYMKMEERWNCAGNGWKTILTLH